MHLFTDMPSAPTRLALSGSQQTCARRKKNIVSVLEVLRQKEAAGFDLTPAHGMNVLCQGGKETEHADSKGPLLDIHPLNIEVPDFLSNARFGL